MLSDWFAGWANAAKTRAINDDLTTRFERLIDRQPTKIDWNYFACSYTINGTQV